MDKFKSIIFSILILAIIGGVIYWAVTTLQSGPEYIANQEIKQLKQQNQDLNKQVESLSNQVSDLQNKINDTTAQNTSAKPTTPTQAQTTSPKTTTTSPSQTTNYKYQDLINQLQKLVSGGVVMKAGSSGTRVGTVQNFLNIYNKTSAKVDNDYGNSTQSAVASFQKDQGLPADGQAGASTFNKMISWLKSKG